MAIEWPSGNRPVSIAPLVTFRITFGLLMFFSLLRFWQRGWITSLYVTPTFHFTYWGFEWVQPLGDTGMHLLFLTLLVASGFIVLGLLYLVAFLLIWLPANRHYALDACFGWVPRCLKVPAWTIGILRIQLGLVYVFAGLAKLNSDWLLRAEPLKTWLPAKSHLPLIGPFLYDEWVAYLFSWFGAGYDLFIVFYTHYFY